MPTTRTMSRRVLRIKGPHRLILIRSRNSVAVLLPQGSARRLDDLHVLPRPLRNRRQIALAEKLQFDQFAAHRNRRGARPDEVRRGFQINTTGRYELDLREWALERLN